MRRLILLLYMLILSSYIFAQGKKIANYYVGTYEDANYESFSFYISENRIDGIEYTYTTKNNEQKTISIEYVGTGITNYEEYFKVKFKNGLILFIYPQTDGRLKVVNSDESYKFYFSWEYQGPVDGMGAFCSECAEDANESIRIINTYFLKKNHTFQD